MKRVRQRPPARSEVGGLDKSDGRVYGRRKTLALCCDGSGRAAVGLGHFFDGARIASRNLSKNEKAPVSRQGLLFCFALLDYFFCLRLRRAIAPNPSAAIVAGSGTRWTAWFVVATAARSTAAVSGAESVKDFLARNAKT